MKLLSYCLLFCLVGCTFGAQIKIESRPNEHVQVCEMCKTEWHVNSTENVPPTIRWCIHDASFCQDGFAIYKKTFNKSEMVEHCQICIGCRCAIFSPEEWDEYKNSK